MKKICLLIAAIAVISCNTEVPVDYAVVSGKIANNSGAELSINSFDGKVKEVFTVAEDGSFVDTLTVATGNYILFDGKNRITMYLDAGSSQAVNYDANDFDNTITVSGVGSEVTNYLSAKSKKERELLGPGMTVYELEEADYKAKFAEVKTALTGLLESTEGISEDYKAKELRNLGYGYKGKLGIYQMYHAHFAKKPDFKVSPEFLEETNLDDYQNEDDYKFSSEYKKLVSTHYRTEAILLTAKDSTLTSDVAMLKAVASSENEYIKNDLLYDAAKYGITYTEDLENFYAAFTTASTNEANNKEIKESYDKLKTVAKGMPSPKFVGYENYAGGSTSLDDLKGKFVYVDVWATWCGPCKAEIPFLKEVEKEYHGKNIEFVSLSIDKKEDYDKWRAMIEEKELGGIQVFADKDWQSDFVQDYLIKGIPRFILIDPEGNIVSSNAPRPSSPKLIEMFNENSI